MDFRNEYILETEEKFDLIICLDVFEHVEDYIGFLRKLRRHAKKFVFNIPLDLNFAKLAGGYKEVRENVGHLHYFNVYTALETLKLAGFAVEDHFLSAQKLKPRTIKHYLVALPRKLPIPASLSAKLFGGYSLVVTANQGM